MYYRILQIFLSGVADGIFTFFYGAVYMFVFRKKKKKVNSIRRKIPQAKISYKEKIFLRQYDLLCCSIQKGKKRMKDEE